MDKYLVFYTLMSFDLSKTPNSEQGSENKINNQNGEHFED